MVGISQGVADHFNSMVSRETFQRDFNKKFMFLWLFVIVLNMVLVFIPPMAEPLWLLAVQLITIGFGIMGFMDSAFKYKLYDNSLGDLNRIREKLLSGTDGRNESESGQIQS